MKKLHIILTLIFLLFMQKAEGAEPLSPNVTPEVTTESKPPTYMFDFKLDTYCGEFYLKIYTHDFYPDYNLFSWEIDGSAGQKGTVTDWIFPDDASFVNELYRYKRVTFDSMPIPVCVIKMKYNGEVVMTKTYTILGQGSFMAEFPDDYLDQSY